MLHAYTSFSPITRVNTLPITYSKVVEGFNVFWHARKSELLAKTPVVLVMTAGMYPNMDSAEESRKQSAVFDHDMAIFHEVALDACLQQHPKALICFISCSRLAVINSFKRLTEEFNTSLKS